MEKTTTKPIEYRSAPYGHIATIPAGTKLIPASNLPDGGYWAEPWDGMTSIEEAWQRNYGFHITESDLE
jgi:hypothetical protein